MASSDTWADSNSSAMEYALGQFEARLETSREDFADVDFKARYWLTGMLGLVTALTAWFIKNDAVQDINLPLLVLLSGYALAAILFAFSLSPRPTGGKGITPENFDIFNWRDELNSETGKVSLMARVIKAQKEQIEKNEKTVGEKSSFIKWGIWTAVITPILCFLFFLLGC